MTDLGTFFTSCLLSTQRAATVSKTNYAYKNKVTSQTTMSYAQSLTGNLLFFATQKNVWQKLAAEAYLSYIAGKVLKETSQKIVNICQV